MYKKIPCGTISGEIIAPPSKSITHRLLVMAALSGKHCRIGKALFCQDTLITLEALGKMGYEFKTTDSDFLFCSVRENERTPITISVGNSGTSARLLTAVAALQPREIYIDGSSRMRERPMGALVTALKNLGITIEHRNGFLPLRLKGGNLKGGEVTVDASQSSQFLSALLLIAPCFRNGLLIAHGGNIASRSYVDLTLALMRQAGIQIETRKGLFKISGEQRYEASDWTVEGDLSNASYFLAAAAITRGEVLIRNLPAQTAQGDRVILKFLEEAGARIQWEDDWIKLTGASLKALDRDMRSFPDLVPTLAIVALFAEGSSRLRNVGHLRYKESDRISTIIENIWRLGGKAFLQNNDLIIEPRPLHGALIKTYNDHRMAMSFAMAGLRIPEVVIENPQCVNKSYPAFWEHFSALLKDTENAEGY